MGEARICVQMYIYVTFVAVVAATSIATQDKSCRYQVKYYEDLGCTPVYKRKKDLCPIKYDCDDIGTRDRFKCYINGNEYELEEFIDQKDGNVCDDMCVCKRAYNNLQIAAFECIDILPLCRDITPKGDCYLQKNPANCCKAERLICPLYPYDRAICNVNGKEYMDGEDFIVDGDPELTCICQPGYQGENVPPFCVRSNHSTCKMHPSFQHKNYFLQKCAPVYMKNAKESLRIDNCYFSMKCQTNGDKVTYHKNMYLNERDMCQFGNIKLQIGDILDPFTTYPIACVECICEVPPLLTCKYLKKGHCRLSIPASYV